MHQQTASAAASSSPLLSTHSGPRAFYRSSDECAALGHVTRAGRAGWSAGLRLLVRVVEPAPDDAPAAPAARRIYRVCAGTLPAQVAGTRPA
jgi:hypothetical protein